MIKDFRALVDNVQDPMHCVVICSGTQDFINYQSRNKTYILDEQLHAMEPVLSMVLRFKLRVEMVNTYLRYVDTQGASSVSNGSKSAGQVRVRFHPKPDCGNGSYHTKNPDRCKWAGFTTKNPGLQPHNFGSN